MSAPQSGGTPPAAGQLYTRQSSGLIRSVSLGSAVGLNITNIGVIFAILGITAIPAGFPNADPLWTAIIVCVICLAPALLYGVWTAILPRSGGDYVWNSRVFRPWVGFAASFLAVVWFVLVNGYLAYLVGSDALPTALIMIGKATGNPALADVASAVSDPTMVLVLGIIALLIGFGVAALGIRRATRIILVFLVLMLLGLVVAGAVLIANSRADFMAAVGALGTSYDGYISAAAELGWVHTDSSLAQTLFAMPPLYLGVGYAVASSYAGGELSGARKSGLWGPPLAVIVAGVLIVGSFAAAASTIGFEFIGAASTVGAAGSAAYTLPAGPNYFTFVSLLSGSPIVAVLMGITYVLSPLASICVVSLYCTRSVFAWSFDRILPDRLAGVNERTGAPLPALVFVFVLGLAYLLTIHIAGTTTLETLGATVVGSSIAFILAAVGAIILPFWKKTRQIYELSPLRGKVFGIPVLSLIGLAALIVYVFMFVVSLSVDAIGANTPRALISQGVVLLLALVLFPISSALNRRRGVNLSLLGKELPPE